MCVFSPSLSPDQDPLPGTARGCTLQGCHSQTSVLLTATEAGGCSEPTTLATAYSAEPCVLQLRRSREKVGDHSASPEEEEEIGGPPPAASACVGGQGPAVIAVLLGRAEACGR